MIVRTNPGAGRKYFDTDQPLPGTLPASQLLEVVDLDPCAPEAARKYVRTTVHIVRRPDGTVGYQVVNSYAPGVSLIAIEVVNSRAYVIMHDEVRYPLPQEGFENVPIAIAARMAEGGRWSREIVSGGVNSDESPVAAAIREAREESGLVGLREYQIERLFPTLYGSVSTNRQPFNLFSAQIEAGQWQPELVTTDVEEGYVHVGAYQLPVALDMIGKQIVELSTVLALYAIGRHDKWQRYL
jgi:8-oxo-dGTP pyrophosphatase MutT (NUDIX family)